MSYLTNQLNKNNIEFKQKELLQNYSTIAIGGKAKWFILPKNIEELQLVIQLLKKTKTKWFILGNGSNTLFDSRGYKGAVIKLAGAFMQFRFYKNTAVAGASVILPRFAAACYKRGLSGLQFGNGIPASIGGAVVQNAGAGGQDISGVIEEVVVLNKDGQVKTFLREKCCFAYRESCFKKQRDKDIILFVHFSFRKKLKTELKTEIEEQKEKRRLSQPIGFSLGCIFQNGKNFIAGRVLDELGFKGKRCGGAVVSEKHANFILNAKHAKSRNIKALIKQAKRLAKKSRGVILKEEITIVKK